jgi:hypothetical protein
MVQFIKMVLESFNHDWNSFHELGLPTRGTELFLGGGGFSLGHLMVQIILSRSHSSIRGGKCNLNRGFGLDYF